MILLLLRDSFIVHFSKQLKNISPFYSSSYDDDPISINSKVYEKLSAYVLSV
ncbi:hypothetical protein D3C77_418280 [compost metagenome]